MGTDFDAQCCIKCLQTTLELMLHIAMEKNLWNIAHKLY